MHTYSFTARWVAAVVVVGAAAALGGCGSEEASYTAEVEAWHAERMEGLRQPDSWLSLVGLYWLEEGTNTFGSDSSNDVAFPPGAPARMGSFVVSGDSVKAVIAEGIEVSSDGQRVDTVLMATSADDEAEPTPLSWESLTWILINRDGRYAIRLKDSRSAALAAFHGIERFPVDPAWRIVGRFEPYRPAKTIDVPTVMGTVSEQTTPGRVVFEVNGMSHRVDVTGDPGDERYFVIFADATNGEETYPAGRYMWIDAPDEDGRIILDFNKSYNPPCVFTPYATCPFPPRQNRLPVRINAGEKTYEADKTR